MIIEMVGEKVIWKATRKVSSTVKVKGEERASPTPA